MVFPQIRTPIKPMTKFFEQNRDKRILSNLCLEIPADTRSKQESYW